MAYIELKNVTFSYPDTAQPAIRSLSLKIEKGQFVVLFGSSGSGKSTLLRLLKKEIQPHGKLSGEIRINGEVLQESNAIGFVFQDPENQIVADEVLHELVFGLENSGIGINEMRSRVAEMVHYFGADELLQQKMQELSGGKKQLINLASVLLMQPDILLLDEPTSQLDPVSARELLDLLLRLNEEFGMTIVLAEHRLEELSALADKMVLLEGGEAIYEGDPREVLPQLWSTPYSDYIPSIPALFFKLDGHGTVPLTVKEGRSWLRPLYSQLKSAKTPKEETGEVFLQIKEAYFRYHSHKSFVLDELDFRLNQGEIYALMGGNGSGKSTLLKIACGIIKPEHGKVLLANKPFKSWKKHDLLQRIGYLPQNPKLFFLHDTVEKEIEATMQQWGLSDRGEIERLLERLDIAGLRNSHPYDLSGGELQKAAIACLLMRKPDLLLLDEPTKGLDPVSKKALASILTGLKRAGMTVLLSTHDIEFAAQYATRCGMMFQGRISSEDVPERFFNGNFFYTTMVQRLLRPFFDHRVLTVGEEVPRCRPNE